MGRGSTMYCRTCKAYSVMGYSSYGSWMDDCRTVDEFDYRAENHPDKAGLGCNERVREFLCRHDGHDIVHMSEDWSDVVGNQVLVEVGWGDFEVFIDGLDEYKEEP